MPKLSIITINLNNLAGLQKTMESVFSQTFTDYEYIIIDGGSTDGSKEYIEQHKDKLAYWVSEQDKGLYDALNKGSQKATGEYLHHLNSGDTYYTHDALQKLFAKERISDFVYGNQNLSGYFLKAYPSRLTFDFFCKDAVPHQATIIKREFFNRTGPFSTKYSMGGDYKFFIEAVFLHQCSYEYSGITLVNYDMTGISTVNVDMLNEQFKTIREESLPNLAKEFSELNMRSKRLELLENSRSLKWLGKLKKIISVKG